jgi:hypothetical protein
MIYALIFTLLIVFKLYQKQRKKNSSTLLSSLIFRGFIIGFVSFFFFILGEIIISTAYSYVFDKKYKAKVISYNPGDDMQIPVVEFKDDQSRTIQLPLGHSINNPKVIGTVIQVSFGEDKLLAGILLACFFILSLAILGITLYAFDRDISFIWKIIGGIFAYLIIPGAMLGFIIAFCWAIWEYFQGKRDDMPIWALGVCSLFTTLLIPALLGYLKLLLGKKDRVNKQRSSSSKT